MSAWPPGQTVSGQSVVPLEKPGAVQLCMCAQAGDAHPGPLPTWKTRNFPAWAVTTGSWQKDGKITSVYGPSGSVDVARMHSLFGYHRLIPQCPPSGR